MIGHLTGTIDYLDAPTVIVNVQGVGYEVDCPMTTFCALSTGQTVTLWTHFVVREDAQQLYGFLTLQDKHVFRTLLKVNGVGAKMALAILSSLSVEMLIYAIEHQDLTTLIKVPGVGRKTAERLLIELRDRFKTVNTLSSSSKEYDIDLNFTHHSPIAEAEAALMALGYKPLEAQKSIAAVKHLHDTSAELIRAALKSMMKN